MAAESKPSPMTSTCDFCQHALTPDTAENVALLDHMARSPGCEEQFGYMVENLGASWPAWVSGP